MPEQYSPLMLELAKRKMQQEMPEEMAHARIDDVPDARGESSLAYTTTDNKIHMNPKNLNTYRADQNFVDDTLAHELVHVRQNMKTPAGSIRDLIQVMTMPRFKYGQDSQELEAFQAMKDRAFKQGRVTRVPTPPFLGGYMRANDIELPKTDANTVREGAKVGATARKK
jgi:hypothetical protein